MIPDLIELERALYKSEKTPVTVGCEAESDDIANIDIVFTGGNLNQKQVENVNINAL